MALKALSQNGIAGALVRVLDFQRYTAAVDFATLERARFVLDTGTHAFADPNEADARGISLRLPTPKIWRTSMLT